MINLATLSLYPPQVVAFEHPTRNRDDTYMYILYTVPIHGNDILRKNGLSPDRVRAVPSGCARKRIFVSKNVEVARYFSRNFAFFPIHSKRTFTRTKKTNKTRTRRKIIRPQRTCTGLLLDVHVSFAFHPASVDA